METIRIALDLPPSGPNFALGLEGRAIARNWDRLTRLADRINIPPLHMFLLSQMANAPNTLKWHSASEAVSTVSRLLSHIPLEKLYFEDSKKLLRELILYENILCSASARGSRFHFVADESLVKL